MLEKLTAETPAAKELPPAEQQANKAVIVKLRDGISGLKERRRKLIAQKPIPPDTIAKAA